MRACLCPVTTRDGKWTGYYVEVYFASDAGLRHEYQLTTPGYVWPDTLPFADCHGVHLVQADSMVTRHAAEMASARELCSKLGSVARFWLGTDWTGLGGLQGCELPTVRVASGPGFASQLLGIGPGAIARLPQHSKNGGMKNQENGE